MPTFFKGAAYGTHWHANDACASGFAVAVANKSVPAIIRHITAYSHPSPYLSISGSFAVARSYAFPTSGRPGYVYEIDIVDETQVSLIHPTLEILKTSAPGLAHLHDGGPDLILGIAARSLPTFGTILVTAPNRSPGPRSLPAPRVTSELSALVAALRDAEVLATAIPKGCVIKRHLVT